MRGNLHNPERVTWSFEIFVNRVTTGYLPPDLYDAYPCFVVEEVTHLLTDYQSGLADIQEDIANA